MIRDTTRHSPRSRPGTSAGAAGGTAPGADPERALDPVTWLTYDELADRLGIERESARTLVKRKRWARQTGNDGKARIGVPDDALEARDAPGDDPRDDPAHVPPTDPVQPPAPTPDHVPVVVEVLTRHVERLEAQVEAALLRATDRDAVATERDLLAAQVEALRGALDVAGQDRDRWHELATRAPEPPPRPWWRRMAG